ncbi:unnamed protein product [Chrysoparadoxa australica]
MPKLIWCWAALSLIGQSIAFLPTQGYIAWPKASSSRSSTSLRLAINRGTPLLDDLLSTAVYFSPLELQQLAEAPSASPQEIEAELRKDIPAPVPVVPAGVKASKAKAMMEAKTVAAAAELRISLMINYLLEDFGAHLDEIRSMVIRSPELLELSAEDLSSKMQAWSEDLQMKHSQKLATLIVKRPDLLCLKPNAVKRVTYFYARLGLGLEEVDRMLTKQPNLFQHSIETYYEPAVTFFLDELGVPKLKLRQMVKNQPSLCTTSVVSECGLRSKVAFLVSGLGLTKDEATRAVIRHPTLLCLSIEKNLKPTADWMVSTKTEDGIKGLALSSTDLRAVVSRQADLLWKNVKSNLHPKCVFLTEWLGVTHDELKSLLVKQPQLLALSIEGNLKPTLVFLKDELGIKGERLKEVVMLQPSILTLSVSGNIRPKIGLLQDELGARPADVARLVSSCPRIMNASVQLRILPRIRMMRAGGVEPTYVHVRQICTYTDTRFHSWLPGLFAGKGALERAVTVHKHTTAEHGVQYLVRARATARPHQPLYPHRGKGKLLVRELSKGLKVLDLYSGTGGFGLNAGVGGAVEVRCVEKVAWACKAARRNAELNDQVALMEVVQEDVVNFLKSEQSRCDLLVFDPPSFSKTARSVNRGAAKYSDILGKALQLLDTANGKGMLLAYGSKRMFKDQYALEDAVRHAAALCAKRAVMLRIVDQEVRCRALGPNNQLQAASFPDTRAFCCVLS